MRLYEYEAKRIFSSEGIPIPKGKILTSLDDKDIFFPCVLKSQVLTGGRGKSGGIKIVNTYDEFVSATKEIFSKKISGLEVKKILVEEKLDIQKEYYAGVLPDKLTGKIVIIFSSEGGIEIENVAKTYPERISKLDVDILSELDETKIYEITSKFKIENSVAEKIVDIITKLYNIFVKYDAEIVEINPLVLTRNGEVISCDARMSIYDDAIPRQIKNLPDILSREDDSLSPLEREARKVGLGYIEMDGDIGVIGNGAGLNLTTLDMLEYVGLKPANFLEVSGRTYDKSEKGLEIILKNPNVKAVFGNFFGCISRCDVIAEGIANAIRKGLLPNNIPMIVAMRGNGGIEGQQILRSVGLEVYDDDEIAIKRLKEVLKR